MENLLRRVVREELGHMLAGKGLNLETSNAPRHPFDLSDAELVSAESLLDETAGQVLRHRVMAWRLEKQGAFPQAFSHRRKADSLEKQNCARKQR